MNSIHKGTIVSVQTYGAFVRLGDGSEFKDGLLHISRLSASGRVDKVEDVVAQGDGVWVKVVEVKEDEGKYSLDMRYVGQRDGEDKDPNNTQVDAGGGGKGRGMEPIRIGAVQSTTCSKCGARGHAARECWAVDGKSYALVEEPPMEPSSQRDRDRGQAEPKDHSQDPALVKEALRYYLKRKAGDASSSSSSSSSSDKKKKKKKQKKKEKKARKKEKKKEKKEQKKLKKKQKKEAKAAAKEATSAKETKGARESKEPTESKEPKESEEHKEPKQLRGTKDAEGQGGKEKKAEESDSSSSS